MKELSSNFSPHGKADWGFGEVLRMSAPTCMTMLNVTILRFVDGLMVSRVSSDALSAQQVAGMSGFVLEAFVFGTLGIISTFVGQSFGEGRRYRCSRYAWAGVRLGVIFGLLCMPLILLARPIMSLYGHSPEVLGLQTVYVRYMVFSIILTCPSRALDQFFYGIHRPIIVFLAAITANIFNVGANYVLIFGKLGLPAMGLEGAAIGSCLAWALQLALLLAIFLSRPMNQAFGTRRTFKVPRRLYAQVLRFGWPAGLQFGNTMFCWNFFTSYLIGGVSPIYLNAHSIVMRYGLVTILPIVGIGTATTAIVGRYIGAGRPDIARKRTHSAIVLALLYVCIAGSTMVVLRYPLVRLMHNSSQARADDASDEEPTAAEAAKAAKAAADSQKIVRTATLLLICMMAFQLLDAPQMILHGALRGAGDTHWTMIVETVCAWTLEVGAGLLMVRYVPQLEGFGPYITSAVYLLVVGIFFAWRFESGAWRHIDIFGHKGQADDTPPSPAA